MVEIELVREVYKNATKIQKYLIGSKISGEKLYSISQKNNLDQEMDLKFSRTVSHIILNFYKIEDTVPLLQQELGLDAKTAALLGADVLDFLAPLSDPNWQPPVDEDEDSGNNILPVMSTPTLESESYPAPSTIPNEIPELRTMAADMVEVRSPVRSTFNAAVSLSDEPVYSSTQPTIVRPDTEAPSYSAPLYQPPKPNVDAPLEKPRWG